MSSASSDSESSSSDFAFNIDVPVRTEWRNVSLLVTSVQNCFNAMFANLDGSQMIAMVTGELLENAIKYGSWSPDSNPNLDRAVASSQLFRLSVAGKDKRARVLVENPANEANAAELMSTLEWIKSFKHPDEAYRAKLLQIAQAPRSESEAHESKLGLVRVAYEASCTLDATFERNIVRVIADMKL